MDGRVPGDHVTGPRTSAMPDAEVRSHVPHVRSTVFSTKGLVASSQPLASQAGLEVLNRGGNAADAAVATARRALPESGVGRPSVVAFTERASVREPWGRDDRRLALRDSVFARLSECAAGYEREGPQAVLHEDGVRVNSSEATLAPWATISVPHTGLESTFALSVSQERRGDIFCLFYDAKTRTVRAINGSGRAPEALSLEYLRSIGINGREIPLTNMNAVTVPGAASGWLKTVEEFGSGRLSMAEILAPAIRMAEQGVPTHELHANAASIVSSF
ncbi:hypothetical protein QFC19_002467 [Naganishia cerealis]|uniref:Uncharacterized protein n=1 Tax=Naganishia cerealis TaxID=610337 RepID=A0ACC2W8X4_9TREE|nr:hypothetical protein QFC19_002467 [Naganishia cerealis]